jgi:hypothetical protein
MELLCFVIFILSSLVIITGIHILILIISCLWKLAVCSKFFHFTWIALTYFQVSPPPPVVSKISMSYVSECEEDCLLGCCAVQFNQIYQRLKGADCLIVLMMEAVSTSETSMNFHETTWRNIPEDRLRFLQFCWRIFLLSLRLDNESLRLQQSLTYSSSYLSGYRFIILFLFLQWTVCSLVLMLIRSVIPCP